ncbi:MULTISPECIES: ABC transporter substrate-binding protein [Thermomonospora]|uniref:Extracellular solute-binding protein family 5 n=1 Tax=Thermomonospora curvata (strain ATCC 19995 / DSM 43183 / JCM 3096 / KCTC 9072 / NBRC 15933 / NCIMB 10081 / Henssen B9) TaxID=471852 RepID=D1A2R4_THECD|nr:MULTISPECIES: ABC transporter substrate-binding protein [Thermomonospora]ACY97862.1 extracellular solute-binding protein family 5 [Thermomonospora curvata DSM 43183]PKK14147.1 MAG: peptide ABC transporter substrate-binding protein [Thermomonospora sp. CIF 1]
MKTPKVWAALTAGAVALSLGLTACGGGDDGDSDSSGLKFDAGTNGIVNPSDKKGGTLKVGMSDDFDSTDPGDTYYAFGNNFIRLYTRTLMTYTSQPGAAGLKPSPDLAEAPGVPSDDNKTWTFKLKKGLKYEDGTEIKAEHIKYAVARTYDRGVLGHGPAYFPQLLDADGYKGPYKDKNLDNFKGIETPDDYTLIFKLKEPFPEFNELVTFSGQTAPVPPDKDKGAQYRLRPLSSGPYKWEGNYQPKKGGVLVRNEHWDPSTDPNRKALPDRIEVIAGIEANEVDNRLMNGELHVDLAGSGVQDAARQKILTNPDLKAKADNPLAGFHWYIPINLKTIPNLECRKAIVYAADRDAMWRAYGGDVGGERATSIQPPNIAGRQKGTDFYTSTAPGYKGDVDKAKEALQKCGKPDGFSTTMVYRSDRPKEKAVAEALEQSLARVGIKLTLKGYPAGTYTGEQLGSPSFVKKENIGLGTYGWAPDWPTGYGYLQALTDGKAIVEAGNTNVSELDDPEINKLWNDVVKITDAAEREKIYNRIDEKARELAAILPNVYAKSLLYRPETLTNVYFHQGFGMYDYANLGVTG